MEKLEENFFYTLEKSIKVYRQFAQKNIIKSGIDITIDQWLILKTIEGNPGIMQQQIAINVFKDFASVTRIIEILVKKKYIKRKSHPTDGRRFEFILSDHGSEIVSEILPVIHANRKQALREITRKEQRLLQEILSKITQNCTHHE